MDSARLLATTQVLGITASLLSAGMYFVTSYLVIPPLYPLPINESTRIFADLYNNGFGLQTPLGFGGSAIYAVAAYLSKDKKYELGAASLAGLSTMIFTILFMFGGIERLLAIQKMDGSQIQRVSKVEVVTLLQNWKRQNYFRALFAFLAGITGLYATAF